MLVTRGCGHHRYSLPAISRTCPSTPLARKIIKMLTDSLWSAMVLPLGDYPPRGSLWAIDLPNGCRYRHGGFGLGYYGVNQSAITCEITGTSSLSSGTSIFSRRPARSLLRSLFGGSWG